MKHLKMLATFVGGAVVITKEESNWVEIFVGKTGNGTAANVPGWHVRHEKTPLMALENRASTHVV